MTTLSGSARYGRIAAALLEWYARERRLLPWRALPGRLADPYRTWISEVMLQQVRVAVVARHFEGFVARFPDAAAIAAVPVEEMLRHWGGLGRYARAHNLHAAARRIVAEHDGRVPREVEALRSLPGIGPYTAAAIRALAFGIPDPPMDPNLDRVAARLFLVTEPLPAARPVLAAQVARLLRHGPPGDIAQALMDLGATLCRPRGAPRCEICPVSAPCRARRRGMQGAVPVLPPRPPRQVRFATAFWAVRPSDGAVLLRRRPPRGPLAGTLDLPATEWRGRMPRRATALAEAPFEADWRRLPGEVRHSLSGFEARVAVFAAPPPPRGRKG
ncbi:MAG: A/G-specific adenine glycosylase, partial [Acetobacteraceae bacterium]|nr:A/G-specific adenine glycosylase [Acetobacteraceae bacterium]